MDFGRIVKWRAGFLQGHIGRLAAVQMADDFARQSQGVVIVTGQMVDHTGSARVQIAAAQRLGRDDFAGRRLDQWRAAKKNGALVLDDNGLVRHRRHIGAAGGATAHHHGDLGDPFGRHIGLIVERAAKMLAVGEDIVLIREIGAAAVDQIDTR